MAEDKKSFVLYADLIHTVRKMPKDKAGELFLTILSYVNDENPVVEDVLVDLVFEPIKLQMKRDLRKYEQKKQRLSENGKKGGLQRSVNQSVVAIAKPGLTGLKPSQANQAVNDTVTDTVIKNISMADKPPTLKNIEERKNEFIEELKTYLPTYGKDMLNSFFKYWTEKNKTGKKMRWELEKTWEINLRLETWAKRDNQFGKPKGNETDVMKEMKKHGL